MRTDGRAAVAFGARVRQHRERLGLSQRSVAAHCGVTQAALSLYEQGRRDPPLQLTVRIAALLGVRVEDLLSIADFGEEAGDAG